MSDVWAAVAREHPLPAGRCIVCGRRADDLVARQLQVVPSAPLVDVAACRYHDDPEMMRYWYREWVRFHVRKDRRT
jgi:hypothetical protein